MNKFIKLTAIASFFATSTFADESFGGVGLVYKLTKPGAEVQEIIPNTPIVETKIKAGDVIVAVDGVSIQGKTSREVKNALRGLENKPVVLTYLSEGDTLVETVRRVKLTVKQLNGIADAEQPEKKLLAVLDEGRVVENGGTPVSDKIAGIYVDDIRKLVATNSPNQAKEGTAKIASFNRSVIRVKLEADGAFVVSVVDSNGDVVRSFTENHGRAGINSIYWDGSLIPDGRYAISVEHDGTVSGINVLLK
ncbi:MAG: PDZ domain-containing protein [Fibrobacter sp.]|nr:PDZ domain-containing protein [Fibrobacter sp.]